jgi:hypothetical protein
MVKVENMISNKGNSIANQFIIEIDGTLYFQSYRSIIVKIEPNGNVYLDEHYWDYSNTTGKYRNQFLGETKKETVAKINDGTYKLVNLN